MECNVHLWLNNYVDGIHSIKSLDSYIVVLRYDVIV